MNYVTDISLLRTSIVSSLRFIGVTTTKLADGDITNPIVLLDGSLVKVRIGTIAIYNSQEFVYTGDMWTELNYEEKMIESPESIVIPHNCVNCGAPLSKGQCKCEYCGTEYY